MPRTKLSKSGEITAFSEVAFRNNNALVEYCRTFACALSGCTAGIMGLTGLQGFAFYFCAVFGLWCLLLIKAGPSWEKYFINRLHLLTNGFFGGLFTYVLFWTGRVTEKSEEETVLDFDTKRVTEKSEEETVLDFDTK